MSQLSDRQPVWPDENELQALGRVIHAASTFEHSLGTAFCALVGSKYAAVLIGGKTSGQLIDDCRALTKAQRELTDANKAAIVEALNRCTEANRKRNRLVHDMWAFGPGDVSYQLRRERSGYDLQSRPVTYAEITTLAQDLISSSVQLRRVLFDILGSERTILESQLRWEDSLAAMTPETKTNLMRHRLAGMLGEMSRLLTRYGEQSWANWATNAATDVKGNLNRGLAVINLAYDDDQGISVVTLHDEPQSPDPASLEDKDPNTQLSEIRQQIRQLATHLASGAAATSTFPPSSW